MTYNVIGGTLNLAESTNQSLLPHVDRQCRVYRLLFLCLSARFFTARRYASAVLAVVVCPSVCLSVCLSVRHKPVLYQNGYR